MPEQDVQAQLKEINKNLVDAYSKVPSGFKAHMVFSMLTANTTVNELAQVTALLSISLAALTNNVNDKPLEFENVKKELDIFQKFTAEMLAEKSIKDYLGNLLETTGLKHQNEKTH